MLDPRAAEMWLITMINASQELDDFLAETLAHGTEAA